MRTKSAARAAARDADSEFGEVSMIANSAPHRSASCRTTDRAVRLCGHNGRGFPFANVAPSSSACLRIKVDDGCGFLVPLCRDCQVECEGSLTGTALLSYYRYSVHVHMYTCKRVD